MSEEWKCQALCKFTDIDFFTSTNQYEAKRAKAVCANCPVSSECLQYALDFHIEYGIWGGLTPRGRRALRQSRRGDRIVSAAHRGRKTSEKENRINA